MVDYDAMRGNQMLVPASLGERSKKGEEVNSRRNILFLRPRSKDRVV